MNTFSNEKQLASIINKQKKTMPDYKFLSTFLN